MSILLDEYINLRGDSSHLHTLVLALPRDLWRLETAPGQAVSPVEAFELVLVPGLHGETLAGPMGKGRAKQRGDKSF
jgi:hypothetical protein